MEVDSATIDGRKNDTEWTFEDCSKMVKEK
jgi:hypothetical protein